ncbi:hypothetical protein LPJ55_000130 [Coemansia sp. RSA 990]|nr:major facilitator superfamily domain-containing protein [Coemansia mojavensis]KAJ1876228.1 hypothetical protein LPJ55_000130 [Coemansia sp. RSA 990]
MFYKDKPEDGKDGRFTSIEAKITEEELPAEPAADSKYAWIVTLGSFFLLMVAVGTTNSYGVYLQEYQNVFPTTPKSTLTWIGSLQFGGMCFFGVFAGVLVERFDSRWVILSGCVLSGAALLIASACTSPAPLIITQGILFGASGSCILIPTISMPSQWTEKYRALATGLAVAGGSIGGLWMSFASRAMMTDLGYQWSLRINGLLIIGVGLMFSPLMRKRMEVPKRDKIIDLASLTNIKFVILFFASMFAAGGYFAPYYYMPPYVETVLKESDSWGANISSILNAGSIVGRVAIGFTADYIGPLNALLLSSAISTIAILVIWLPFKSLGALIVSAVIFGFCSGSLVSLIPVITANLFGIKRLSSNIGLLFISYTIGSFICSPVAGSLLDKYGHGTDYTWTIVYAGLFFGVASILLLILRVSVDRHLLKTI